MEESINEKHEDESLDIDIAYEIESKKIEEINYQYIQMSIQAFVPIGDDEKATEEVNQYINELSKNNPKLYIIMKSLWDSIRQAPETCHNQNVSNVLEDMFREQEQEFIQDF